MSFLFFCLIAADACGQSVDTLRMTLKETDQRFLEKNLSLLANKANIDIARAQTQQARLWDNPVLSTDNSLFHPRIAGQGQEAKFLDPQQLTVQVQQLFKLAGQRTKQVNVQLANEKLTEFQFYDLTRNLKRQLHADYNEVIADYKSIQMFQVQIRTISTLLEGMRVQVQKGFLAQKELYRVQAELVTIQHNMSDASNRIADAEGDLHILLQESPTAFILPADAETAEFNIRIDPLNPADLVTTALQNRGDLAAANAQLDVNKKTLILQKSLAIPDLTVGTYFLRSGGAFVNDIGLTLSIPLPVLNKNQGNIKGANLAIQQQQYTYDNAVLQVTNDVYAKYFKLKSIQSAISTSGEADFMKGYEEFFNNLVKAYQAHTIGFLEFIDFFESYKDVKLAQIQYRQSLRQAADDLNFVVGKDVL